MEKRPNRIAEWRKARMMSQERLAELCGTTHATISRLERGKLPLGEHWLRTIGRVLRVSMVDLLLAEEQEALNNAADVARDILATLPPEQRRQWLEMGEALAFRQKAS